MVIKSCLSEIDEDFALEAVLFPWLDDEPIEIDSSFDEFEAEYDFEEAEFVDGEEV